MIEDNGFDLDLHPTHGAVIYNISDEQRESPGYDDECFQEMVRQFKAEKGPKYMLHTGDQCDWLRPTMREKVGAALAGDPSARKMLDDMVIRTQDKFLDEYSPFEGRTIGCHEGHHSWRLMSGITTDQRFASAMRARHLGWIAATRLRLFRTDAKGNRLARSGASSKTMLSTHGSGGGKAAGSDASAIDGLAKAFFADIYVRGHSCGGLTMPGVARREIRREGALGTIRRTPWYVNVPGMCEGFTNGWETSYAERAGFLPKSLGWATTRFRIVQRKAIAADNGLKAPRKQYANSVDVSAQIHIFGQ